jgi:hypothetical protein
LYLFSSYTLPIKIIDGLFSLLYLWCLFQYHCAYRKVCYCGFFFYKNLLDLVHTSSLSFFRDVFCKQLCCFVGLQMIKKNIIHESSMKKALARLAYLHYSMQLNLIYLFFTSKRNANKFFTHILWRINYYSLLIFRDM